MRTHALSALALLSLVCSMALASEVGPEVVLPASPLAAHTPAAALGAGKYLVVWESGRAEAADIYGCRLDETGKVLDAKPFLISSAAECQDRPRVAWGRDCWLVVWEDVRNDKDFDVYAARVSPDGKCLDPNGILVAGGENNQCNPDVGWNGEHYLVAWRSWEGTKYGAAGARIASDGKVLDGKPLELSPNLHKEIGAAEPQIASVGNNWVVCWVARERGYPNTQPGPRGLYVATISLDGKVTLANTIKSEGMNQIKSPAAVTSDGKNGCLFSWSNTTTGGRSGPENGMPFGAMLTDGSCKKIAEVELGGKKVPLMFPSPVWDGKGYAVVFYFGGRIRGGGCYNTVAMHMISSDGKYEGKTEIASSAGDDDKAELTPPYAPAACGGGEGRTLVVYEKHPAKPGESIAIATKLVKR